LKVREDIRYIRLINGFSGTGDKLFTGVNDAGDQGHHLPDLHKVPVSFIPLTNISSVLLTPGNSYRLCQQQQQLIFAGINERR
jgi:hypothetical protein